MIGQLGVVDFYWFGLFMVVNGALIIFLALNISRLRIQLKLPYGDGDNKDLKQAIRAHMNAVEHMPLFALIVLGLVLLQAEDWAIRSSVVGFSIARLMHAYGMLARHFNLRRLGAALTYFFQGFSVLALAFSL